MSERKVFALQDAAVDPGTGEFFGHGAAFNNVDEGKDIIEPGFFAPVLEEFKREGFIAWGHDWQTPVAMPSQAYEDERGLALGAKFHSDATSQRARTIAQERLANGMSMGLSIGYEIAKGGAKQRDDGVRLLSKASRLFEVSLVMVPMNREATVASVKDAGITASEQFDLLERQLAATISRANELARPRKEGRVLSSNNRTRLEQLLEQLAVARTDIEDLLASTDTGKSGRAAEIEYLVSQARDLGFLI